MKVLLALCLLSIAACHRRPKANNCITDLCTLSINYPYDAVGEIDTRPGTWGRTAYDDGRIQFTNVPKGYRVRIERTYGNVTARLHGAAPPETYVGVLFGLITTNTVASSYATLSSGGCMLYLQADIGPGQARIIPFDVNTHASGLLESDSVLLIRRAIYLNETEVSVHIEPSLVVEFHYEKGV